MENHFGDIEENKLYLQSVFRNSHSFTVVTEESRKTTIISQDISFLQSLRGQPSFPRCIKQIQQKTSAMYEIGKIGTSLGQN